MGKKARVRMFKIDDMMDSSIYQEGYANGQQSMLDDVIEIIDSLTFELSDEYVNGKTKICNSNALKIELHKRYGSEGK